VGSAPRDAARFFAADLHQTFAAYSLQRDTGDVADRKIACPTFIPQPRLDATLGIARA